MFSYVFRIEEDTSDGIVELISSSIDIMVSEVAPLLEAACVHFTLKLNKILRPFIKSNLIICILALFTH
jgi:hypothetical protein